MPFMNDSKRLLKWLWQCAGKRGPLHHTMTYTAWVVMGATIIRNSRIQQPAVEHKQDEQEKPQLTNEGKEGLGITQQLEAVQARKSIEPRQVPNPSCKETDVD